MHKTPLRVGVWFDTSHCSYGGPTAVLLGTLLGFKQLLRDDVVVLLNEPGDVNWSIDRKAICRGRATRFVTGPMALGLDDGECQDYASHPVWQHAEHVLVPTEWVRQFICNGMPYGKPEAGPRRLSLWPSGVDVDFFSPLPGPRQTTQDFFIYFKSQKHADLRRIQALLFQSYFQLRGSILAYYCHTPEMLRAAARASRFCIVLNNTETQGLAMLEIMACNCPLFVIDCATYEGKRVGMKGASSCPCWSPECGVKSSWETLEDDFAAFLIRAPYAPRAFVESNYSWKAAAASLLPLLVKS